MSDITNKLITDCVYGKTFADIGPLWETVNERVSVAHRAGAKTVSAIDKFSFEEPHWAAFHDRMKQCGIVNYESLSLNILEYDGPAFDVVHCGGVLYHAADPIHLIKKIRSITKERLIMTSTVTPENIQNEFGTFSLPEGSMVFVPALSSDNKRILSKHWSMFLRGRTDGGLIHDCGWHVDNYDHWWWLFTPAVLIAMYTACGFKVDYTFVKDDLCTCSMT